jgi:hypothetical protein
MLLEESLEIFFFVIPKTCYRKYSTAGSIDDEYDYDGIAPLFSLILASILRIPN